MPTKPRWCFALRLLCVGTISIQLTAFWLARNKAQVGWPDFSIFYTAGVILRNGQGHELYNNVVQSAVQRQYLPIAFAVRGLEPFNHPAFEAIMYVPLAYLGFRDAYMIWLAINFFLLIACVAILRTRLPTLGHNFPGTAFLVSLAFFPAAYAIMQGQDSILLLLLYCLIFATLRDRKDVWAGVFLGLALFKFHLVLPFVLVLAMNRRWRVLFAFSLTGAMEATICLLLIGWKELIYYPFYLWDMNRRLPPGIIVPYWMPNLRGLFMGWSPASRSAGALLLLTSVCIVVWVSHRWRVSDLKDLYAWDRGFSIALIATFLVGYHSYSHDMSILLLPLLVALTRTLGGKTLSKGTLPTMIASVILLSPLQLLLTLSSRYQNVYAVVPLLLAVGLARVGARQPTDTAFDANGTSQSVAAHS